MILKLHTKLKGLLVIAALACCITANGQQLQAALSHYSTDEGMTSNAVSDIIRDDYGYLWIATWNGLSRFDGFHFYNYKTGNTSGIPLLHNRIMDIYCDQEQNIWMRMYDGHIFVVDRITDRIINPLQDIKDYADIKTSHRLFVSSEGKVYAIIDGMGIYSMKLEDGKVKADLISTNGLKAVTIVEGYKNMLWVGTDKGIHSLIPSEASVRKRGVFIDEDILCMASHGNNVYAGTRSGKLLSYIVGQENVIAELGTPIYTIFVDSRGLIWFTQEAQGVSRLNPETGNIKSFTQQVMVPQYDINGAFYKEADSTLFISMNLGGFGYYNRERDEVEYFHNDPTNPWNLSNTVHAFEPLPDGVIWESTSRRGLEKLEILKNTIVRKPLEPGGTGYDNEIRAIYYDKERQKLLIGNKNNTLAIFSQNGSRIDLHGTESNPLGRIYGINKDHMGNYWVCSKGNGVIRITPTGGSYSYSFYKHQNDSINSLSNDNAYYAIEDHEGNIWVATYGGGINILVPQGNGGYRILNSKNGLTEYPKGTHEKIRTIALDKEGNIWAGTTDGLLTMSFKDGKFTLTKLQNCKDHRYMMGSNDIICMACDPSGSMWIGTNGGGLCHTIGKDEDGNWMYDNIDSADGLPSDEIKSLTFDSKGYVWFSTDRMLCSFDTKKHILSTLTIQDGVDGTMISECGAFAMPNDDIYFGTIDGYYFIDRKKLTNTKGSQLKLRITDFFLNDAIVSPRNDELYDFYVPDSRFVELPSHSVVFSIRFASLNYQLQHRVHYQYMLEGYDNEWHNADRSRTVSYSDLPAGTYLFKVKAFLLESPENYDVRTLEIKVPPYQLLSSFAIWIYLALAVIGILSIFYIRQKKGFKENQSHTLKVGQQDITFSKSEDYEFMKKQMEWLEDHYTDCNLRFEDMIAQSTLGKLQYYKELEKYTGMTPKEYVTDFRLKKALQLLDEDNDMSTSEIAMATGFNDPVYFTRSFKIKTGLTPSRYRNMRVAKQAATEEKTQEETEKAPEGSEAEAKKT